MLWKEIFLSQKYLGLVIFFHTAGMQRNFKILTWDTWAHKDTCILMMGFQKIRYIHLQSERERLVRYLSSLSA